jgi:rod shape-determining protein MreC
VPPAGGTCTGEFRLFLRGGTLLITANVYPNIMPRSIRDTAIVLLLIAGGLLILFSSEKSSGGNVVSRALYTIVSPVQRIVFAAHSQARHVWSSYIDLVSLKETNRMLKQELLDLRRQNAALLRDEQENRRLRKLLKLKAHHEFPSVVAQVIGEDAVGWYRTFFINRGSEDGVRPFMAVTAAEGVVGRVARTSREMSQVVLVTDPNLAVDCRVARTRDRGVLTGSTEKKCVLRYLRPDSDVRPDDEVVTSGLDGIFPRGLRVGRVESVTRDEQRLFDEARVIPAVNFSEIEEVLVILGDQGGFDIRSEMEER